MKSNQRSSKSPLRRIRDVALGASALAVATGCLQRPIGTDEPQTTNLIVDQITQTAVDKIDLLFMIDNSISMADKQEVLALAVPVLVERLVNPVCIDGAGNATSTASPDDDCPQGASREFPPLEDIHVGIVTSSMGDAGANEACVFNASEMGSEQKVDNGYLLGSLARGGQVAPGFLDWTGGDSNTFSDAFRAQVIEAGEFGCGFEASLEAWYHFLVDPTPWSGIDVVDCAGQAAGSGNCRQAKIVQDDGSLGDPVILNQRAEFLRPDSLVAVVMVTDENDCSIIVGGPFNLVARTSRRMFRGSDACASDPNDPCCYSCGTGTPSGCADGCGGDRNLPNELDEPNLRCYEQKRRFGLDFLYPVQRYVNALTRPTLGLCRVDLDPDQCAPDQQAANPLFAGGEGALSRDGSLIFLAGIVGVPYQLIQATNDVEGNPYPGNELHFLTNAQLSDASTGTAPWERIIGDATARDAHMLESIASDTIAGRPGLPTAANPGSDDYHGHEWTALAGDDLQYACIFPLPATRDCDGPDFADGRRGCDCRGAGAAGYTENNPLCYNNGAYSSVQVSAKAYPGLRELETLRAFGNVQPNAIVASICARNVSGDTNAQDFGYNPAVGAIVDRLKEKLGGRCLSRELDVEEIDGVKRGKPACSIVEASPPGTECVCDPNETRTVVNPKVDQIVRQRLRDSGSCSGADCDAVCLCELIPAGGTVGADGIVSVTDPDAYAQCQTIETPSVSGWCYVDQGIPVITGDAGSEAAKNALVADCPAAEKRILRFVGQEGQLRNGSTTFVACKGASLRDRQPAGTTAGM